MVQHNFSHWGLRVMEVGQGLVLMGLAGTPGSQDGCGFWTFPRSPMRAEAGDLCLMSLRAPVLPFGITPWWD